MTEYKFESWSELERIILNVLFKYTLIHGEIISHKNKIEKLVTKLESLNNVKSVSYRLIR